MFYKGKFTPKHPEKYKGNPTQIIYRSGWELRAMIYFDQHPGVIWWQSEETIIPYISPVDNQMHRYFVDFTVKVKGVDNVEQIHLFEVKPAKQTKPPKPVKTKKPSKRHITEAITYGVNAAKWDAARAYCAKKGWKFHIITEKELGLTK